MLQKKDRLSIVIPVFNEEDSIAETVRRLSQLSCDVRSELDFEYIFVDDGSSDNTLQILRQFSQDKPNFKVLSFTRNFGHQIAITAGIDVALGDYVAVIDADLQDPPELILEMYQLAIQGYEVVYGKRRSRAKESAFKKTTAAIFYRFLNYVCDVDIPRDTGDFRVMSRLAVDALNGLRERHRFIRGMVPWLGFKTCYIEYDREQRYAGETKYSLSKMVALAGNAIISFSSKPLTLAIRLGMLTILLGIMGGGYMLYLKLFTEIPIPGLTAILLSIVFFSGIQILLIGLVGEYVARIFEEVKGRPLYIVSETINF